MNIISYFCIMSMSLIIVVLFFVGCWFAGQFLLYDMWVSKPKPPKIHYDPEHEEYKDFKKSLEKELEKEDITLQ